MGDFFFLGSFELSPCAPTPLFTPKGEQGVSDCIFPRAGWGLGRGFPNRCSAENGGSRWGQRGGARSRGAGGAGGCRVLRAAALAAGSQPWPRRLLGEEVTTAPSREQQSLSLRVALACVPRPLGATQGSSVQVSRGYRVLFPPCGRRRGAPGGRGGSGIRWGSASPAGPWGAGSGGVQERGRAAEISAGVALKWLLCLGSETGMAAA